MLVGQASVGQSKLARLRRFIQGYAPQCHALVTARGTVCTIPAYVTRAMMGLSSKPLRHHIIQDLAQPLHVLHSAHRREAILYPRLASAMLDMLGKFCQRLETLSIPVAVYPPRVLQKALELILYLLVALALLDTKAR